MKIDHLLLQNFRNYPECAIQFQPGLNILVGRNAQGKTNLLESIHFLSTGKSHRTNNQLDLIRWDNTGFFLRADITKGGVAMSVEFRLQRDRQRELRINGLPERRMSSLLGVINCVLFAPEDLQLLKGPPALRRRFLDMELSQISSTYLYSLQQYNRVLNQKNRLLKTCLQGRGDRTGVDVWNQQLVRFGAKVMQMRANALELLGKYARINLFELTGHGEELSLIYRPAGKTNHSLPKQEEAIRDLFWDMLRKEQADELARGQSLVGPHRDDFSCLINNIDVRSFGSQGQQRTCVLALKLAEIEFMHKMSGHYPILLLDDVLSELDEQRRSALLQLVDRGIQTLMTGTEAALFAGLADKSALIAEISNGHVRIVV
ncbi:MAG: DNA replication/repair protein RecF [Bacillota bacterium]|jgi:DNA replication and repair protein RecF